MQEAAEVYSQDVYRGHSARVVFLGTLPAGAYTRALVGSTQAPFVRHAG